MLEFNFGDYHVVSTQPDLGLRVWHCDCSEFERRLLKYGEGFCEHVVLAIECAIREQQITLPAN